MTGTGWASEADRAATQAPHPTSTKAAGLAEENGAG